MKEEGGEARSTAEAERPAAPPSKRLREPIRVVAGPGTGKTRVLTRRVAHLVESGARASSVLALTFTNRAANELEVEQEINPQDASSISVGTFHRVCLTMLRGRGGARVPISRPRSTTRRR